MTWDSRLEARASRVRGSRWTEKVQGSNALWHWHWRGRWRWHSHWSRSHRWRGQRGSDSEDGGGGGGGRTAGRWPFAVRRGGRRRKGRRKAGLRSIGKMHWRRRRWRLIGFGKRRRGSGWQEMGAWSGGRGLGGGRREAREASRKGKGWGRWSEDTGREHNVICHLLRTGASVHRRGKHASMFDDLARPYGNGRRTHRNQKEVAEAGTRGNEWRPAIGSRGPRRG